MKIHLVVTVGLAIGLILIVSALAPDGGAAAKAPCDRWVVKAGANSSDCSDQAHPCKTVQYAIDQAADGDVICVAYLSALPGPTTYNERLVGFLVHLPLVLRNALPYPSGAKGGQ